MIQTTFHPSGLAVIEMVDPKGLNAINSEFAQELGDAVRHVSDVAGIRVVLLRSTAKCFGVGGDVNWFDVERPGLEQRIASSLNGIAQVIEGLRAMPAVVVAAVYGAVAGGSLGLMLAADLVIAHEATRFSFAYAKIGATPDAGISYFLTRCVGERRALELLLLNDAFDAKTAQQLGLVNFLASADVFEASCQILVDRLLAGPAQAQRATKRLVQSAVGTDLGEQMRAEALAFAETSRSRDFMEGVNAFMSKRAPTFRDQ